ncbi:hypothetical protein BDK51DRAFT_40121 [Blyttiomyces helicus]|uniref:Retrovirus-related Pol polyprotein from transposon TNT 1-94-like beta-barrel domain-containing protein n=1 Tax=Blyttiomyces helicus TaxID=388810 RepID=A0A4P9WCB7_9FUNG|nr:hypothetical protein BDK51DRAFT_40121 [Blyttiomyces helicus]|eukprot:RKO88848.1 hypothetical protein BDK51DRAFT_40121 [Blyttiomyces helicus]
MQANVSQVGGKGMGWNRRTARQTLKTTGYRFGSGGEDERSEWGAIKVHILLDRHLLPPEAGPGGAPSPFDQDCGPNISLNVYLPRFGIATVSVGQQSFRRKNNSLSRSTNTSSAPMSHRALPLGPCWPPPQDALGIPRRRTSGSTGKGANMRHIFLWRTGRDTECGQRVFSAGWLPAIRCPVARLATVIAVALGPTPAFCQRWRAPPACGSKGRSSAPRWDCSRQQAILPKDLLPQLVNGELVVGFVASPEDLPGLREAVEQDPDLVVVWHLVPSLLEPVFELLEAADVFLPSILSEYNLAFSGLVCALVRETWTCSKASQASYADWAFRTTSIWLVSSDGEMNVCTLSSFCTHASCRVSLSRGLDARSELPGARHMRVCYPEIPKITEKNYHDWKFNMTLVIVSMNGWGFVSETKKMPGTGIKIGKDAPGYGKYAATWEEWHTLDYRVFGLISLHFSPDQRVHVRTAASAKEAWDNLAKVHNAKMPRKYERQHITKFEELVETLEGIDAKAPNVGLGYILLMSLGGRFQGVYFRGKAKVDDDADSEVGLVAGFEDLRGGFANYLAMVGCDVELAMYSKLLLDPQRWILDFGATRHMTDQIRYLWNIKPLPAPRAIAVGGKSVVYARVSGSMVVDAKLSTVITVRRLLEDVLYVPKLGYT